MAENRVEIIIHTKEDKYYKLSNVLTKVNWSGTIKSPSRSLMFSYLQGVNDKKIEDVRFGAGCTCCFYVDDVELYRGTIVDVSRNSSNNEVICISYDMGHLLTKDEMSISFSNKKVSDIAKEILKGNNKAPSLAYKNIAKADEKISKIFNGVTRYDAIMTAYTEQSKKDKKKYMIVADLDKLNIIEKGIEALKIEFSEENNLESASYQESIEGLVNRVIVTDQNGNKLIEKVNEDIRKIYKKYVTKYLSGSDKNQVSEDDIKNAFKGMDRKCSLTGYGDVNCRAGYKVSVKDSFTGLVGIFYIDSDSHTWDGGKYTISLELNFENIMDEKSADEEANKSNGYRISSTKDWGHGVTAEQLNKVLGGKLAGTGEIFLKYANMYKINPAVAAAIAMHESANGTSNLAKTKNNFFGMRSNKKGWLSFSSVDEGIRRGISNISKKYVYKGKNSLSKMVKDYAEGGKDWIPQTSAFYKKITGKDISTAKWGTGVKTDAEAKSNIIYTYTNSGGGTISGINGYKFVNEKQRIVVEEAYKMIGKGRYTYGGRNNIYNTDCSGFIYFIFKRAGISMASSTAGQKSNGRGVSLNQAMAGDIIVMDSKYSPSGRHVVLCVGNGMIIHNGGPGGKPITKRSLYTYGKYYVRRCWE